MLKTLHLASIPEDVKAFAVYQEKVRFFWIYNNLMAQQRDGDVMYYAWEESLLRAIRPTLKLVDDENTKDIWESSSWGTKNFHGWYVENNLANNDDYVKFIVCF